VRSKKWGVFTGSGHKKRVMYMCVRYICGKKGKSKKKESLSISFVGYVFSVLSVICVVW